MITLLTGQFCEMCYRKAAFFFDRIMRHRNDKEISMQLKVGRDMTPVEEEQFLNLLFSWFVRDYENNQNMAHNLDSRKSKELPKSTRT